MSDLDNNIITAARTSAIEGFVFGKAGISGLLQKELGATTATTAFIKDTYPEMISLKLARGKKDPEKSGTIGYIVHPDGSLEELADKTKLSEVGWGGLGDAALVICYLGLTSKSFRIYSGTKMQALFGVNEESDSLD